MNSVKQAHVQSLRANTAYPVYRGFIGVITTLLMIIAVLNGLGALIAGFTMMRESGAMGFMVLLLGIVFAVLAFFMAKFWKEAAEIGADIADTLMDTSARTSGSGAAGWSVPPTSLEMPTPGFQGGNNL